MKSRYIIGLLLAFMGLSLYMRIVLPYDNVFTGEWIKFTSVDAYWQMAQVDRLAPDFINNFAVAFKVSPFVWLLSGVAWCIGLGSPTQHTIDVVGVYFPTILAALTIIPVYFIGKIMFGRMAAIIAAFFIAILPGEWLARSALGFTDDHVLEVLLSTTAVLFFVLSFKSVTYKKRILFTSLFAITMVLYLPTFAGGVIFLAIAGAFLCVRVACNRKDYYSIALLATGLATVAVIYFGKPEYWHIIINYASGNTILTTSEMRPLFFPFGTFTPMVAWGSFWYIAILVPVAISGMVYRSIKDKDVSIVFVLVWSIAILVLMLAYRRFAYYFAINASLITGWFVWYTWQRLKVNYRAIAMIVTTILLLILAIPNMQHSFMMAKQTPFAPSDAWHETLDWVKSNTAEDSKILAWWDYGYWIDRIADRQALVNPSQDKIPVTQTAQSFITGENIESDYIIIDQSTTGGKFWAIATWAGEIPSTFNDIYYMTKDGEIRPVMLFYPEYYQSFVVRLYNFGGEAFTPQRSSIITFKDNRLIGVTIYESYEEAISNILPGQLIVGENPYNSPVPLKSTDGYSLIYESSQTINGIAEVKVFKVVK